MKFSFFILNSSMILFFVHTLHSFESLIINEYQISFIVSDIEFKNYEFLNEKLKNHDILNGILKNFTYHDVENGKKKIILSGIKHFVTNFSHEEFIIEYIRLAKFFLYNLNIDIEFYTPDINYHNMLDLNSYNYKTMYSHIFIPTMIKEYDNKKIRNNILKKLSSLRKKYKIGGEKFFIDNFRSRIRNKGFNEHDCLLDFELYDKNIETFNLKNVFYMKNINSQRYIHFENILQFTNVIYWVYEKKIFLVIFLCRKKLCLFHIKIMKILKYVFYTV